MRKKEKNILWVNISYVHRNVIHFSLGCAIVLQMAIFSFIMVIIDACFLYLILQSAA